MGETYFDRIRNGQKTTTLRYWRRRRVQAGSLELVPGLGLVRIEEVRPVTLAALRLADARADGFESLLELRRTLKRIYPPATRRGRKLFCVRFTYLPGARGGAPRAAPRQ